MMAALPSHSRAARRRSANKNVRTTYILSSCRLLPFVFFLSQCGSPHATDTTPANSSVVHIVGPNSGEFQHGESLNRARRALSKASGGWIFCAKEKRQCTCPMNGKIAYGVQGTRHWTVQLVKHLRMRKRKGDTVNGVLSKVGVSCDRFTLKKDPKPKHSKVCFCGSPDTTLDALTVNFPRSHRAPYYVPDVAAHMPSCFPTSHTLPTTAILLQISSEIGQKLSFPADLLRCTANVASAANDRGNTVDVYMIFEDTASDADVLKIVEAAEKLDGVRKSGGTSYERTPKGGARAGSFFQILETVHRKRQGKPMYDVMLKLGTEANPRTRLHGVESLCGSKAQVQLAWNNFGMDVELDLLAPFGTVFGPTTPATKISEDVIQKYIDIDEATYDKGTLGKVNQLRRISLSAEETRGEEEGVGQIMYNDHVIVGGSMFWIRTSALQYGGILKAKVWLRQFMRRNSRETGEAEHILKMYFASNIKSKRRLIKVLVFEHNDDEDAIPKGNDCGYAFRANPTRVPTISFKVCEGLTNQRIAIMQGLAIAVLANLPVVLPNMQSSFDDTLSKQKRLSDFFDETFLEQSLSSLRVHHGPRQTAGNPTPAKNALRQSRAGASYTEENTIVVETHNKVRPRQFWEAVGIHSRLRNFSVELGCTFNSIAVFPDDSEVVGLLWAVDNALRPNAAIQGEVDALQMALGASGAGVYTALHVRIEDDWVAHCRTWTDFNAGRDNCMVNTEMLLNTFIANDVPETMPVYLAGGFTWDFVQKSPIFDGLKKRYKIVMKDSLIADGHLKVNAANREWYAMIDYEICKRAATFVGNSVSTFSAVLELARLKAHVPAFHYNAGPIPLEKLLPIGRTPGGQQSARLKWVFSIFIGDGSKEAYLKMAKVAITSAHRRTTLSPFCIFNVAPAASAATRKTANAFLKWMEAQKVVVIRHTPKWAHKIQETVDSGKAAKNVKYSPLYNDASMMISTFARFDIPILGFTDDYVLYADVDVMFVSDVTLKTFAPLPKYMLCGTESQRDGTYLDSDSTNFYANAGVILYNMRHMRNSHQDFINFAFSADNMENGLHYGRFGPGDQGAYNMFYSEAMNVQASAHFNYKPYWEDPDPETFVSIVHWHGPKVVDYGAYLTGCEKRVLDENYDLLLKQCSCSSLTATSSSGHTCLKWHRQWKAYAEQVDHAAASPIQQML